MIRRHYTGSNTINDLINDTFLMARFYKMFPEEYVYIVPEEFRDDPMDTLPEKVQMPWGMPYMSEAILDAANKVYRLVYDERYEFIQLWREEQKKPEEQKFFPLGNEEEDVCLIRVTDSFEKGRPVALVVPGGSYHDVVMPNEGLDMADELAKRGYAVAILYYRVAPHRYPIPQMDLALAIKYLRTHAEGYGVQKDLLVVGFSAGGHLVASEACYYQEIDDVLMKALEGKPSLYEQYQHVSAKADSVCLSYPVINCISDHHEDSYLNLSGGGDEMREKLSIDLNVSSDYPKTFVWSCDDDDLVPSSNAKRLYAALQEAGVESMLQIYPTGNHGVAVGKGTSAEGWIDTMVAFMAGQHIRSAVLQCSDVANLSLLVGDTAECAGRQDKKG